MIHFEYIVSIRGSGHLYICSGYSMYTINLLPILSVFLLHSPLTSHPSCLAGKGEEHLIQKTQTYTTVDHYPGQPETSYLTPSCIKFPQPTTYRIWPVKIHEIILQFNSWKFL